VNDEIGRAVYIAPFKAGTTDHGSWPFDLGDDPSFHSAFASDGPITWGVCRRDVRRLAQPGDVLLFFSFEERAPHLVDYKFCALLTIERKIKRTEIWQPYSKKISAKIARLIKGYKNLLVRPHNGGWEHWEPGLPKKEWHSSWLSRLTFNDPETDEFTEAQTKNFLSRDQAERFVDENYVVFSAAPEGTFICERPKVVANCDKPGELESWRESDFARKMKCFTVGHTRGSLRIRNMQRPHRHSIWRTSAREIDGWRDKFIGWLHRNSRQLTSSSALALSAKMRPRQRGCRTSC
jgi:hypothetical protein